MILASVAIVADVPTATTVSDDHCTEARGCTIHNLVLDWEHVSDLDEARRDYIFIDLFVDVKSQVFTLTEKVALFCQHQPIRDTGIDAQIIGAIPWLLKLDEVLLHILRATPALFVGEWVSDGVQTFVLAHEQNVRHGTVDRPDYCFLVA